MMTSNIREVEGTVRERLSSDQYTIETARGDHILAALSYKLSRNVRWLTVGMLVIVEVDMERVTPGRVVRVVFSDTTDTFHDGTPRHDAKA